MFPTLATLAAVRLPEGFDCLPVARTAVAPWFGLGPDGVDLPDDEYDARRATEALLRQTGAGRLPWLQRPLLAWLVKAYGTEKTVYKNLKAVGMYVSWIGLALLLWCPKVSRQALRLGAYEGRAPAQFIMAIGGSNPPRPTVSTEMEFVIAAAHIGDVNLLLANFTTYKAWHFFQHAAKAGQWAACEAVLARVDLPPQRLASYAAVRAFAAADHAPLLRRTLDIMHPQTCDCALLVSSCFGPGDRVSWSCLEILRPHVKAENWGGAYLAAWQSPAGQAWILARCPDPLAGRPLSIALRQVPATPEAWSWVEARAPPGRVNWYGEACCAAEVGNLPMIDYCLARIPSEGRLGAVRGIRSYIQRKIDSNPRWSMSKLRPLYRSRDYLTL